MPNFHAAVAAHPAAYQSSQSSTLPPSYSAAGLEAAAALSPTLMLQAPNVSSKASGKWSPKIWPKRSANVVPVNTPLSEPALSEWLGVCVGTKEEFTKLHEDYGKEVKELIADWSRRGRDDEVVQGGNLIDFG